MRPPLSRVEHRLRIADELAAVAPPELVDGLAPQWSPERFARHEVIALWTEHLERVREGKAPSRLQFYAHVPFCRTRCGFCQFESVIEKESSALEAYVDAIEEEARDFESALGTLQVDAATLGGGTPSQLDEAQLGRLLELLIDRVFRVDPSDYFSVELNPDSSTREKMRLLAQAGVNRVSLGVQSLHTPTLRAVQRGYQTESMVRAAVNHARHHTRLQLGLDLLAPLPEETEASFVTGVERVLDLEPDQLVVYDYQPVERHGQRLERGPLSFAWCTDQVLERATTRGYARVPNTGSSVVVERPGSRTFRTRYMQHPREPSSMLGLGPFAESYVFGVGQYVAGASTRTERPYTGHRLTPAIEASRFVSRNFAYELPVADAEYRAAFGRTLREQFAEEVRHLEGRGLIERSGDGYRPLFSDRQEAIRHLWLFFDLETLAELRQREASRGRARPRLDEAVAWLRATCGDDLAERLRNTLRSVKPLGTRPARTLDGAVLAGRVAVDDVIADVDALGARLAELPSGASLAAWIVSGSLTGLEATATARGNETELEVAARIERDSEEIRASFHLPSDLPKKPGWLFLSAREARFGWRVRPAGNLWSAMGSELDGELRTLFETESTLIYRRGSVSAPELLVHDTSPRGAQELRKRLPTWLPDLSAAVERAQFDGDAPGIDAMAIPLDGHRPRLDRAQVQLGPRRRAVRRSLTARPTG